MRASVATALVAALLLGACSDDDDGSGVGVTADQRVDDDVAEFADDALDDDVDCSEEALTGGDEGFEFIVAYPVVDTELGDACFGSDDEVVLEAWAGLVAITPPGQLRDLGLFAGFEPDGDIEADTLAFVNTLDADGTRFQMSVNTVEAAADPDELLLTLAHEFSHVFTGTEAQLDRTDEAIDECDTYYNGEGCYLAGSLMIGWIEEFWDEGLIDSVDPFDDSIEDADARCVEEEGFFGSYAATNPDEDFAESFSAFVFRLEPDNDGQQERLDWIEAQPGLSEFRDRADSAGMTPLANNFDLCGI
jgi:hypothetical protein